MKDTAVVGSDIAAKNSKLAMSLYYAGAILALVAVVVSLLIKSPWVVLYMFATLIVVTGLGSAGSSFAGKCVCTKNEQARK